MAGKPRPPQTHCKRGHEFTPANTLRKGKDQHRECRECGEARTEKYERAKSRRMPSLTGKCKKGLHPWIPENQNVDKNGYARCKTCHSLASIAYAKKYPEHVIRCVTKDCTKRTQRKSGGTYICPKHRKNPPVWIFRAGLRIVGTEVLAA